MGIKHTMSQKDINMSFKDCISLSLLAAAFEKSFPHFRRNTETGLVDNGETIASKKVFQTLKGFSTAFPHNVWKDK